MKFNLSSNAQPKQNNNLAFTKLLKNYEDKEFADSLKELYESEDTCQVRLASIINTAISCQNLTFMASRNIFKSVIEKDQNIIKKTTISYGTYISLLGFMFENNLVVIHRPSTKSLASILEWIEPNLVAILKNLNTNEFYKNQKESLLIDYDNKAKKEKPIVKKEKAVGVIKEVMSVTERIEESPTHTPTNGVVLPVILPIKELSLPKEEPTIEPTREVIPEYKPEVIPIKPQITAGNVFDIWFADLPHYSEYKQNSKKNALMEQLILMFKGNNIPLEEALSFQRKVLDVFFNSTIKNTKKDWVIAVGNSFRSIATKLYITDIAIADKPIKNVYKKEEDAVVEYKTSEQKMQELNLNIDMEMEETEKNIKFRFKDEEFDSPEAEELVYKRVFACLKKSYNDKKDKEIEWDHFQTEESFNDFPSSFCPTTWESKIPMENVSHLFDFTGWLLQSVGKNNTASNMVLDRDDSGQIRYICLSGKEEMHKKDKEEQERVEKELIKTLESGSQEKLTLDIVDWKSLDYKPIFNIENAEGETDEL